MSTGNNIGCSRTTGRYDLATPHHRWTRTSPSQTTRHSATGSVVEERHELRPGGAPQLADRRIRLAPLLLELLEPGQRLGLGGGGVDRAEVMGDLVPVLPRREPERVAEEVDDALLHHRVLPDGGDHGGDRVGEVFQPVADGDADVLDAAVLQLSQHLEPELRTLATVAGPQAEDVAFPTHGDPDDDVDRLVPDLTITDFDHNCVDEDDRID